MPISSRYFLQILCTSYIAQVLQCSTNKTQPTLPLRHHTWAAGGRGRGAPWGKGTAPPPPEGSGAEFLECVSGVAAGLAAHSSLIPSHLPRASHAPEGVRGDRGAKGRGGPGGLEEVMGGYGDREG